MRSCPRQHTAWSDLNLLVILTSPTRSGLLVKCKFNTDLIFLLHLVISATVCTNPEPWMTFVYRSSTRLWYCQPVVVDPFCLHLRVLIESHGPMIIHLTQNSEVILLKLWPELSDSEWHRVKNCWANIQFSASHAQERTFSLKLLTCSNNLTTFRSGQNEPRKMKTKWASSPRKSQGVQNGSSKSLQRRVRRTGSKSLWVKSIVYERTSSKIQRR